jgi:hypothetical protein
MANSLHILIGTRVYLFELLKALVDQTHVEHIVGLETPGSYQRVTTLESK